MSELSYLLRLALAYRDVLRKCFPPVTKRYIRSFRKAQQEAARKLSDKAVLEVAFQLTMPNMWKSDYLFRYMQQSPRFHPFIVVTPMTYFRHNDPNVVMETVKATCKFAEQQGYEYTLPYDKQRGRWKDIRKEHCPDIFFFSQPYSDTPPEYFVYNFKHILTCYVPYGFGALNILKLSYNLIFYNLVGLYFVETMMHRQMAVANSRNGGENAVVTGYPGTEVYLRSDYHPADVWKPLPSPKKRIIWAPHHTIDGGCDLSTFLRYCDDMLRLAQKYSDSVQFAFKPHQVLKLKLHKMWGEEQTERYYDQWRQLPNGQLEEGPYVDLFLTSDAIIHDCGSFTTEYLFTHKPCMYLLSSDNMSQKFNDFGKLAFAQYYKGRSVEDIEHFIEQVVVGGNDPMVQQRNQFFKDYLYSEKMPSERIIEAIENMINA